MHRLFVIIEASEHDHRFLVAEQYSKLKVRQTLVDSTQGYQPHYVMLQCSHLYAIGVADASFGTGREELYMGLGPVLFIYLYLT